MTNETQIEKRFLEELNAVLSLEHGLVGLSSNLMGGEEPIDSISLVEICLRLEDFARELGFDFDWTSENAMSGSRGIFMTVETLLTEFREQMSKSDA